MNGLYNEKIKKNWRTCKRHWWILKARRCSLSVHQDTLETPISRGGPLWMWLGTMKLRALTHPDLKLLCKGLRRLCLLFSFDLQEETHEVMNQKLPGLPWWSDIKQLCVLIYSADDFSYLSHDSSKAPENSHLYRTVWIPLKEHGNDCKSLFQLWTKKKDAMCSLLYLLQTNFCHLGFTFVHCMILLEWKSENPCFNVSHLHAFQGKFQHTL